MFRIMNSKRNVIVNVIHNRPPELKFYSIGFVGQDVEVYWIFHHSFLIIFKS